MGGSEKRFYSLVGFSFFPLMGWGCLACGILVPLLLKLNQLHLHWKHGVLTTEQPAES